MGSDPFFKFRSILDQIKRDQENEDDPNDGGNYVFNKRYRLTDNGLD